MTKYPVGNRRLEFLTHLAARSLYRSASPAAWSPDPGWRHWTLPAPEARPAGERGAGSAPAGDPTRTPRDRPARKGS